MRNSANSLAQALFLLCPAVFAVDTRAQPVPDAGQVQRDATPRVTPAPSPTPPIDLEATEEPEVAPGGPVTRIARVEFTGNALIDSSVLRDSVADFLDKPLDLAGLRAITARVTERYRAEGYPFSRAYLLPQEIKDGTLQVGVIEGRYGKISTSGDGRLAPAALRFLADIRSDDPIASLPLERRLLILADQPGVQVVPLLRSGESEGQGDLLVTVTRASRTKFEAGYDNHGSRFTGTRRLRADLQIDSPLTLGDQLLVRAAASDGNLWLGNVTYGFPVGASGWRASLSVGRTSYELGKSFAALEASGTADVSTATLSYSVIRSLTVNLTLSAALQHKNLRDELRAAETRDRKSSWALPLTAQFDVRHASGGISYGGLSWTLGELRLRDEALLTDLQSGRSANGGFRKWNLDMAHLQALGASPFSVFLRIALQKADRNLDSSEKLGLGGPWAVRGYPIGEGNGDEGMLGQLELRLRAGAVSPFVFFDAGRATFNARTADWPVPPEVTHRSVSSTGVGFRLTRGAWSADGIAAWPVDGGAAQSEDTPAAPRVWLNMSYRFNSL